MRREDFFLVVFLSSKLKNYQVLNKNYYKWYLWNNTGQVFSKKYFDFIWPVNPKGKKPLKSKVAAPRFCESCDESTFVIDAVFASCFQCDILLDTDST